MGNHYVDNPAWLPAHVAHKENKAEGHLLPSTEVGKEILHK
jgi:hypothetical protein